MKRLIPLLSLFCVAALLTASCNPAEGPARKGPRVIVLGIDGGTWTMIEPMMEKGELPNLKKLYDSGLHGILESRPPIISPVVWTTIFTGFGHTKHGVKDWKTSQSVNRRVSAIWEILRNKDMKVDVFNVPATWPADPVPGVMMSGFPLSGATHGGNTGEIITAEQLSGTVKTTAAYRDNIEAIRKAAESLEVGKWSPWIEGKVAARPTLLGAMRLYRISADKLYATPLYRTDGGLVISEPKTLRADIAAKIGEPYIPEGPGWSRWADEHTPEVLYQHLEQVFTIQSKAALEYAGGDWDLFLYVMTFVDRVSHPYWGYTHSENFPGMDPAKAKKFAGAVPDSYRRSDEEIGKILAKAVGDPYVVVVSDHGFQSSTDATKPIGTHNPDGIYIVAGPGITPKTGLPKFIEDVTPTLLYLLGLPTGQDMDGRIFAEVTEMIGRKPESVPSYETAARDATDEPVDSDTWESLKGLGYVDGAPPRKKADEDKADKKAAPDKAAKAATENADDKAGQKGGAKPPPAKPGAPGAKAPAAPPPPADALKDWPGAPADPE
ncbi:MAG: alkaline phosphatase family protein [Candidatus Binatia bacterium]